MLFIIRNMIKYLIETLTEDNLVKYCKAAVAENETKNDDTGIGMLENLLNAIMEVLVDVTLE